MVVSDKCVGINNIILLISVRGCGLIYASGRNNKSKNVGDLVAIIYRANEVVDKNIS